MPKKKSTRKKSLSESRLVLEPFEINKNALILAKMSSLAYKPENIIKEWARQNGLPKFKFFNIWGTQGYIVANSKIIVVSFRGTEMNLDDISADLRFGFKTTVKGNVHHGFYLALEAIWVDLMDTLTTFRDNQDVYITGHSLGAALATLFTSRLMERNIMEPTGLYTFGSPRCGGPWFVKRFNSYFKEKAHRFTNKCDFVTGLPLWAMLYFHVGVETRLKGLKGHSIDNYIENLLPENPA